MEVGLLMADILVYVSCKFDMYIFKIALVISENVCTAFLYVLSILSMEAKTKALIAKLVSHMKKAGFLMTRLIWVHTSS